jgi:hypothetical protein
MVGLLIGVLKVLHNVYSVYKDEWGEFFVAANVEMSNVLDIHYDVHTFNKRVYIKHLTVLAAITNYAKEKGIDYLIAKAPYDSKTAKLWRLSGGEVTVINNEMTLIIET